MAWDIQSSSWRTTAGSKGLLGLQQAAADAAAVGGFALSTSAAPARTKEAEAKNKDSEDPGDSKSFGLPERLPFVTGWVKSWTP